MIAADPELDALFARFADQLSRIALQRARECQANEEMTGWIRVTED